MEKHNEQLTNYLEDGLNLNIFFEKPPRTAHNLWLNHHGWYNRQSNRKWDELHVQLYRHICPKLKIRNPIKNKNDLIFDSPTLLEKTILGDEKFDFLIINGRPRSGQFHYNAKDFENLVDYLIDKKHKIITTDKIGDIPCTRDYKFNVVDIARISLNAKNILGVLVGPMHSTFTKFSKAERWYVLSTGETLNWSDKIYNFNSIKNIPKRMFSKPVGYL